MESDKNSEGQEQAMGELSVSFEYQFKIGAMASHLQHHLHPVQQCEEDDVTSPAVTRKQASFSCLSGAALGANATLANTALGNGVLRQEILPGLDSPKSFRPLHKSPSFSIIESLISSSSTPSFMPAPAAAAASTSAPHRLESKSFLSAADAQTAGGAAGEDRIQAVCSEEDGWLFCAIYDGFNGRDAADFLAGTLYENISHNLTQLVWQTQLHEKGQSQKQESLQEAMEAEAGREDVSAAMTRELQEQPQQRRWHRLQQHHTHHHQQYAEEPSFREGVLRALRKALMETEAGFMEIVQQDMDERPDLVMVGSCVLVVLLHGHYLYTMSLGDSRAVLATTERSSKGGRDAQGPRWVQLTQDHVLTERVEKERVIAEHPDDPSTIISDRIKGKIKLTRAFGAGYLKKAHMNEKLMGLLRVANLSSPPYISAKPHLSAQRVCAGDEFVVMGSDGLFDFFTNEEVVCLLHRFMLLHPSADPARYMLDQLLIRAAKSAGMTLERLKNIQIGRRRAYHDDVTIMVVTLGAEHHTSSASTIL